MCRDGARIYPIGPFIYIAQPYNTAPYGARHPPHTTHNQPAQHSTNCYAFHEIASFWFSVRRRRRLFVYTYIKHICRSRSQKSAKNNRHFFVITSINFCVSCTRSFVRTMRSAHFVSLCRCAVPCRLLVATENLLCAKNYAII